MSGPEDKGRATVTEPAAKTAALGGEQPAAVKPVQIWAVVGAAILLLQLYVWIRWVSGPYFERVPAGPTELPTAMKTILTVYTAGIVVLFQPESTAQVESGLAKASRIVREHIEDDDAKDTSADIYE